MFSLFYRLIVYNLIFYYTGDFELKQYLYDMIDF